MDILQEWLESTILRELGDGLNWLESSSEDSAIDTSHFEDDGSTLKVKISKPKGGVVQMTKVGATNSLLFSYLSMGEFD